MIKVAVIFFIVATIAEGRSTLKMSCPGPNEQWLNCGEASPCQTLCETLGEKCTAVNVRCPDGCYCIDGYARDISFICIPQTECPK